MIWQVQDLEERIFWDTRQMLLHLGVLNEQDNYPLQMMLSYDYLARAHLRGVYCPFFLAQAAMHILKCNTQINATRQKATRGADLGGFQTSHFPNITFPAPADIFLVSSLGTFFDCKLVYYALLRNFPLFLPLHIH